MNKIIDAVVIGVYLLLFTFTGKYTVSYIANKVQYMALAKVAHGLSDLEPITQRMTGKKLKF